MAVSLRIPEEIKRRVEKLAEARDTTAHAFMVGAIEERLLAEETRAEYHAEATARLSHMKKTAKGIPAAEVFDYLRERVQGKPAARPRARKIA
jgi:predicted transcriptional regulator